jgi:hypothetical protein
MVKAPGMAPQCSAMAARVLSGCPSGNVCDDILHVHAFVSCCSAHASLRRNFKKQIDIFAWDFSPKWFFSAVLTSCHRQTTHVDNIDPNKNVPTSVHRLSTT